MSDQGGEMTRNIHQRMNSVIAELGALSKGGQTSFGDRYAYHKVDDIVDALRPVLLSNGVSMVVNATDTVAQHVLSPTRNNPNNYDWSFHGQVYVTFVNIDDPSDQVTHKAPGHGIDIGDKAAGKMVSYGWKTAVICALMLKGQPDNEEEESRPSSPSSSAPKAPTGLTNEQLKPLLEYCTASGTDPAVISAYCEEKFQKTPRQLTEEELKTLIIKHEKEKT